MTVDGEYTHEEWEYLPESQSIELGEEWAMENDMPPPLSEDEIMGLQIALAEGRGAEWRVERENGGTGGLRWARG